MPLVSLTGFIFLFALSFPFLSSIADAKSARVLSWEDLLPSQVVEFDKEVSELNKAFSSLSPEELETVRQIAQQGLTREKLAKGLISMNDLNPDERVLLTKDFGASQPKMAQLTERAHRLEEERLALQKTTEDRLNGQSIRLPGYVLPLEFEGTKVTEFLLVPYVGACIHVPPPPPNQIVYVTVSEAFESKGLYAPVWVTGTLSTKAGTHDLSLVDGQAPVSAGYSLDANGVEPYKE